jgi:hypothetical protein
MEELPKDFQSALNETSINSGKDKPSKERFKNQPMEDRIKELLKESTLELAEMVTLKEIELKTERESRREEHGKQQEVIQVIARDLFKTKSGLKSTLNKLKDSEKRIKELEALVKGAFDAAWIKRERLDIGEGEDYEDCWNRNKEEFLKSKGIEL